MRRWRLIRRRSGAQRHPNAFVQRSELVCSRLSGYLTVIAIVSVVTLVLANSIFLGSFVHDFIRNFICQRITRGQLKLFDE